MTDDAFVATLRRFVRGDMAPRDFERWICASAEAESRVGTDLWLRTVSARYDDWDEVDAAKTALAAWLPVPPCACPNMRDVHVVMMGRHAPIFAVLERVKRRDEPYWWLSLRRCGVCGQWWLVAAEERQNDVFCLRRTTDAEASRIMELDEWPGDFDRYERLIELGIAAGIVFRLAPMDTRHTMTLLAQQRPGIRVSELARLVNVDAETAAKVARVVVAQERVDIAFDVA